MHCPNPKSDSDKPQNPDLELLSKREIIQHKIAKFFKKVNHHFLSPLIILIPLLVILVAGLRTNFQFFLKPEEGGTNETASVKAATTRIVSIRNNGELSLPRSMTINQGDSVEWTSFDGDTYEVESRYFSGKITKTETFSQRFDNPGTFYFYIDGSKDPAGKIVVREI